MKSPRDVVVVPSERRTRDSRACSASRARSCSTGCAKRRIRSTRVPEASATCSGVSPARMRAWITRGGSVLPRSSIAPSRASPRAAARTRSSIGSSKRSISSDPSPLSAVRIRLLPSSESATRRSVRIGVLQCGSARAVRERDLGPEAIRAPPGRPAGSPGAARRPDHADRCPADGAGRGILPLVRFSRGRADRSPSPGGAMAGPVVEPRTPPPPDGLPTDVRLAVTEIAGTAGAWCPALSPDGDRIAYVTDRSGLPRLETASLTEEAVPAVLSGPDEEVVSVAWSPDGAWLAYLVSPGGSICAELHVVRPDGSDHHVVAGADPFATVFAGGWTRPGRYVCSIAPGQGPDADVVLVDAETGAQRTLARGGFLAVTHVSADERWVLARRGPRNFRHVVLADVATGELRRVIPLDAPGGIASEDGRFGPDGRSVYLRASLPGEPGADRAGLVVVPLSDDGLPGPGRVLLSRGDADLDGYALRADGTVLAVWTCEGVTQLRIHDLADGSQLCEVPLPEPVMPGWSLAADGTRLIAELTGPRAPRALWVVPLDRTGPH